MSQTQTPSQTIGPFFAYGLTPEPHGYPNKNLIGNQLVPVNYPAEKIRIEGIIFDGNGAHVNDALIEIWQANQFGEFAVGKIEKAESTFTGLGRCDTGFEKNNIFWFETIKPGSHNGQAPFIEVTLFMRGLLSHLNTRIYFSDEAIANSKDLVLNSIEESRRNTLVAIRQVLTDEIVYRFNIHLQGEMETVFFDL